MLEKDFLCALADTRSPEGNVKKALKNHKQKATKAKNENYKYKPLA